MKSGEVEFGRNYRFGENWRKDCNGNVGLGTEGGSRGWRSLRRTRFIAFNLHIFFVPIFSSISPIQLNK
jgi:hypothetical protein